MKAFKLTMMAAMLAFASTAMAQEKVAFLADPVSFGDDGTAELVIKMDYPTSDVIVGYNFSLKLPEGVEFDGKTKKGAVTISKEIHPLLMDDDGEYTADPKKMLQVKDKTDGGTLFAWIDNDEKAPLKATEGDLMTIKLKGAKGLEGEGKIYDVAISNNANVSVDLGNLADFTIQFVTTDGINDIKAADATAPAYNLQGVRVNNAAKGIIIRDGKKTVVK